MREPAIRKAQPRGSGRLLEVRLQSMRATYHSNGQNRAAAGFDLADGFEAAVAHAVAGAQHRRLATFRRNLR